MEEKHVAFDSSSKDDNEAPINSDHGWQKVTYAKRLRKTKPSDSVTNHNKTITNGALGGADNVFQSLEQQSEDRRRRILEAQRAAAIEDAPVRSKHRTDDEDAEDSEAEGVLEDGKVDDAKKVKPKKPKKPKVTVAEAATKIDADHLSAFIADISVGSSINGLISYTEFFILFVCVRCGLICWFGKELDVMCLFAFLFCV